MRRIGPSAARLALGVLLLGNPLPGRAHGVGVPEPDAIAMVEPDPIPEAVFWRGLSRPSLALDPLRALSGPGGWKWDSEWAPLYDGPRGDRIRREQTTTRVVSAEAAWRWGFEMSRFRSVGRSGEADWGVWSERPPSTDGLIAASYRGPRFGAGVGVGASETKPGASLAGSVSLPLGTTASWSMSRWVRAGRLKVRWEESGLDTEVNSWGRWFEERAEGGVATRVTPALDVEAGISSLERQPLEDREGDRLERRLHWRAVHLGLKARALGYTVGLARDWGDGREDLRVSRGSAAYARAEGPLSQDRWLLTFSPVGARLGVKAWSGRTRGEARGHVAMWPFDALLGYVGTRRVANARMSLRHEGASIDLTPSPEQRFDAGLALWRLEPSARFNSWRSPFFGLGREDESSGTSQLRRVVVLGTRLGTRLRLAETVFRVEAIQWIPLQVRRIEEEGGSSGGNAGNPYSSSKQGQGLTSWGGTIVRMSIGAGGM